MTASSRESVDTPVGFSDGEVISFSRTGEELVVLVRAWNDELLELRFSGVLGVREALAGDISDVVRAKPTGCLWDWTVRRAYDDLSEMPGEHLYQFLDHDDDVALEVVALDLTVSIRA